MHAEAIAGDPGHARALLLRGRCPACAERLGARALFRAQPCGRCGRAIAPALAGPQLGAAVEARGRRRLLGLVVAVALAQLLLGSLPLLGALVLIGAAAWIRVGILQPTSALLGPRRRVLTRWTARLVMAAAVAVTVIVIEALTLVPLLGLPAKALIGAGQVALAAAAVTAYAHWQLRREAAGVPIAGWEWLVLVAAFAALLGAVVAVAFAFAALAAGFSALLEALS